jgi:hypothetical protein
MKLKDSIIGWNPGTKKKWGDICVVEMTDRNVDPTPGYSLTTGGCYISIAKLPRKEAMLYTTALALKLVLRHRLRPGQVHRAMKRIDEYKAALREFKT